MKNKIKKSPIKWMGGKSGSVDIINKIIPEHKIYVEPFAGGCWILYNKQPVKVEVINDINSQLINFYKVLQKDKDKLIKRMDFSLKSKELFLEYRKTLNDKTLTDLERAYRFYYVNQHAFGGLIRYNSDGECNSPFGCTVDRPNPGSFWDIEKLNNSFERIKNVIIENDSYEKIIKKYDKKETLFFLDPPYDCKSGKYNGVTTFNYDELLNICKNMKGKFILTLNKNLIDKFKEDNFFIIKNDVHYSIGSNSESSKSYEEIIITNFKFEIEEDCILHEKN